MVSSRCRISHFLWPGANPYQDSFFPELLLRERNPSLSNNLGPYLARNAGGYSDALMSDIMSCGISQVAGLYSKYICFQYGRIYDVLYVVLHLG